MSPKIECHSKWNVTQTEMSFKMDCHSKRNGTRNGMSLKMECHPKWNVIGLTIEEIRTMEEKDRFQKDIQTKV